MTLAVRDLATQHDLASFARRAASERSAATKMLGYLIRGRLTASEELAVMRAWASQHGDPVSSERSRLVELLDSLPLDDDAVAQDVLFVAGSWRVQSEELRALVRQKPEAATRAVVALDNLKAVFVFELAWILDLLNVAQLSDAGASEEMIQFKEMMEEQAGTRGA